MWSPSRPDREAEDNVKTHYKAPKHPRRGRSETAWFYFNEHPVCEACRFMATQEVHHIITRATGGPDEAWNFLSLCKYDHLGLHDQGRRSFAERFPHLADKIKDACKRMGRKF